jgi:uncharacterized protein (DUF2249 family)
MSTPAVAGPTIDIRTLGPCADRKAHVLAAFDALPPGGRLEVVNDHRPLGLLRHFEEMRPEGFVWAALEDGPDVFRVEITRRPAPAA